MFTSFQVLTTAQNEGALARDQKPRTKTSLVNRREQLHLTINSDGLLLDLTTSHPRFSFSLPILGYSLVTLTPSNPPYIVSLCLLRLVEPVPSSSLFPNFTHSTGLNFDWPETSLLGHHLKLLTIITRLLNATCTSSDPVQLAVWGIDNTWLDLSPFERPPSLFTFPFVENV